MTSETMWKMKIPMASTADSLMPMIVRPMKNASSPIVAPNTGIAGNTSCA